MLRYTWAAFLVVTVLIITASPSNHREALADLTSPQPTESAIPKTPPPVLIPISGPFHTIFVLGTGGDPSIRGKLIASFVEEFQLQQYGLANDAWLIPEPDWTASDFVNQCSKDWQHTDGALVIGYVASATWARDELLRRRSWTELQANAMYAECSPPKIVSVTPTRVLGRANIETAKPAAVAYTWHSRLWGGSGYTNTDTKLAALSILLSLGSAYLTFSPSKTATSVSTRIFPTPAPLPPVGVLSSVVTTTQSVTNPSGSFGSIATGLLGQSLLYTQSITAIPSGDNQLWDAAYNAARSIIAEMNCPKPPPSPPPSPLASPLPSPTPAPFCRH